MLCGLFLPSALMEAVYGDADREAKSGDRLFGLTIDLGGAFTQNCPPIPRDRLVLRQPAAVRRIMVTPGDEIEPGGCLAHITTEAGESGEGPVARPLRIATAAILSHPGMWSALRPP